MTECQVPLLVPRRSDGGTRDRLWAHCRSWWHGWSIHEGYDEDGGPFRRSVALNRAAEAAGDWDCAVVLDADVIVDHDQVRRAVEEARRTGRLTAAYNRYVGLNSTMTRRVLGGYSGSWESGRLITMTSHVSSCLAVPRPLWDAVGGFDERFVGWGHEDTAFWHACAALAGPPQRVRGTVWHLYHPPSIERHGWSPDRTAGVALADRYRTASPDEVRQMVDPEQAGDDPALLLVLTDGREGTLERSIPSIEQHLQGLNIVRRVIVDDSGDQHRRDLLRKEWSGFEVVGEGRRLGYSGAMRRAWELARSSGQPWILWWEDDFELTRRFDASPIVEVLRNRPNLIQMVLRRQPWFPAEIAAGGVIERYPADAFIEREHSGHHWSEHSTFFSLNPCLMPRRALAAFDWPHGRNSEWAMTRQVVKASGREPFGYWGERGDEHVEHFGQRSGHGY